ncbi:MAG: hypothetical protein R3D59_17520 [Paracoccaceae bacterium]
MPVLSSETQEPTQGVVLSSETQEPSVILSRAYKGAEGIILSSETQEPTVVKDADNLKGLIDADTLVFDFTAKGIILTSETQEPSIFDPDGDGYTASDDLWKLLDAVLYSDGGSAAILWGDDDVIDRVILSADSFDFL